MTDYSELVKALRDIEKTMFALGTSSIKMDNVSIRLAYDKKWGRTAKEAADAIEELKAIAHSHCVAASAYWEELEELKAQLPKRGEWKPFDLTYGRSIFSCSVCEQTTEVPMCMEKPMYAYCPNCGAKMREVQV